VLVARAVARPELRDEVAAAYRARYRAHPIVTSHVYPELLAVLDGLTDRKLAVLSNKPHDLTCAIAQRLLHRWPFAIIAGEREGWARKPDPAGLLSILAQLGCSPADAVMIGDTEVDVATAKAAGVRSIAVTWGFRRRELLAGAGAIAETPAQLAALLR